MLNSIIDLVLGNFIFHPPLSRAEFANAILRLDHVLAERERQGWMWPFYEIFSTNTRGPLRIVNSYLDIIIRQAISSNIAGNFGSVYDVNSKPVGDSEGLLENLVTLTLGKRSYVMAP